VTKKFKRLARDCDLGGYHFHHLRHTAATLMLASGIELHYVQEILGHTDIKTTQIYAKVLRLKLKKCKI
jgi:site-specific recombinase XerD